jgi:hypothetical protein
LATYRGEKTFAQLDSDKLHKLATKTHNEGDTMALESFLSNYRTPEEQRLSMERSEVQRSDVWPVNFLLPFSVYERVFLVYAWIGGSIGVIPGHCGSSLGFLIGKILSLL